eukprot:CAMPEP_0116141278 /NCGR_PEP_ID=MMETSP0329-20121206/14296_1 /TAXON_ID=697910 /ORGANISM="Pseudo-nitzschia arenysensis, Strain B593" /LENGTH=457 /DNA_ID=CAMNT_0003636449 /DNA_START=149 /DNA_END=1522 /DNA_ORIENTATION=-
MSSLLNRENKYGGQVGGGGSSNEKFDNQVRQLIPAEVCMISGCHSLETSADVSNIHRIDGKGSLPSPEGRAGGACTTALLSILYDWHNKARKNQHQGNISFQQLLLELRGKLAQSGMSQIPQLTSSRPLELEETPFSLRSRAPGGTQRALLVGINYYGQSGQLSGCINDVKNVGSYILEHHGFLDKHVLLLIDEDPYHKPTRENIIRALRRLVEHSKPGDSVYFHYSGHGGLLDPDYWNQYKAGNTNKEYDETLYPVDHARAGQIRDFSLFNHFVKPMAAGVTVTCVMDCCHSGSVLDLPYSYRATKDGTIRMRQSMDSLTNLAFLYILAGGMLPPLGFDSVMENFRNRTGEAIDNMQGIGVEEFSSDIQEWTGGDNMNSNFVNDTAGYTNDLGGDGGDADFGADGGNVADFDQDDGFDFSNDFSGDYGGDTDCGNVDCDGCDVLGSVLGGMLEGGF